MKKLMTMVAAATMAFGLFADDYFAVSSVDFKNDELGPYEFPQQDDGHYWSVPDEGVEGTVTAGDVNYLKLEAETPVYRTFADITGAAGMVPVDIAAEGRVGIIADQKVQFTAFDNETETPDNLGDAKIAVWVKAEADDETKGTLMVTTKALDNDSFEPVVAYTNYDTGKKITLANWYQLTITAIPAATLDEGTYVVPGFKIELGEDVITAPTDTDLWPSTSGYYSDAYTTQGKDLIGKNQLFPSMIKYDLEDANTLVGVGFKGTGSIESIDIAGEEPPAPTTFEITANPPENGTYTVTDEDGTSITTAEVGATVTITATPNTGYELAAITVTGAEGSVDVKVDGDVGTFTMPESAVTVTVTFTEVPTEPIPPVKPDATTAEVNAAVDAANFADTTVKAMIGGDAKKYIAFKTWAATVGGEAAVVASQFAAKSFELSDVVLAPKLFTAAPTVEITAAADATDGVSFNVQLKDGDDPVAVKEAIANSVKVGINLETWDAIDSELVKLSDDAKTVTVTMPEEDGGKCFMKVVITK